MRRDPVDGFTLTELLIAALLAMIVIIAMTRIDVARVLMSDEIRRQVDTANPDRTLAGLAAWDIGRRLERGDRIFIVDPSTIQVRIPEFTTAGCSGGIPAPSCFDDPANYRWDEYRLDAARQVLEFYSDTRDPATGTQRCSDKRDVVGQITAAAFAYKDEAATAPPGGEPFAPDPEDNNIVEYSITWANGTGRSQVFGAEVTSRTIPYSDVSAVGGDSGLGLGAPADVSPPPAPCP